MRFSATGPGFNFRYRYQRSRIQSFNHLIDEALLAAVAPVELSLSFPLGAQARDDVAGVVAISERRIVRLLERRGFLVDGPESAGTPDKWTEDSPGLVRDLLGVRVLAS